MNGNETAAKFQAEVGQVLDSGHCWNLLFVCVWKIFQAVGCQLFFLNHSSRRRNADTEA